MLALRTFGGQEGPQSSSGGLKQCELVLPSPAVAPKGKQCDCNPRGLCFQGVAPADALCKLWIGTRFQGQSLLP